jgi:hypothetical protein
MTHKNKPQLLITDQSHLLKDWKKEYDELYSQTHELLVQAGNHGMRPDEIRMKWLAFNRDTTNNG